MQNLRRSIFLGLAIWVLSLTSGLNAGTGNFQPGTRGEVIYFILLDRFSNGDPLNDFDTNPKDPRGFHGGDLSGVIGKLDYLRDLGITALWISPVFRNRPTRFYHHQPYHGYWVWDFFSVDPRFGNPEKLRSLVAEAHKRGIKVFLDFVVNHAGYDAPLPELFPALFHDNGNITDWSDRNQLESYRIYGLPDFASEKPAVQFFFRSVADHWQGAIGFDGFRLDAVKHVPIAFWKDFNTHVRKRWGPGFFLLGEMLDGDPKTISRVLKEGRFSSLFDFPLYYTLLDVFARGGDARKLGVRFAADRGYTDPNRLATFLDNHDLDRFVTSCHGDLDRYRAALALIFTARGIPVLCYGDEVGLPGAQDPEPMNRRSMDFDLNPELREFTRKLIALRKSLPALRDGYQFTLDISPSTFSFCRLLDDRQAIVVFNTATAALDLEIPLFAPLSEGTTLQDHFTGNHASVKGGKLLCRVPGKGFLLYDAPAPTPGYSDFVDDLVAFHQFPDAFGTTRVTFQVRIPDVTEGETVHVVGGLPSLGDWDPARVPPPMKDLGGGLFSTTLDLPRFIPFEYKFLRKAGEKVEWLPGENRTARLTSSAPQTL